MKRQIMTAFTIISLIVICGLAKAEAQSSSVVVDIPFKFVAGDREMPAGKYTIKPVGVKRLLIQSANREASTTVPVNYNQAKDVLTKARVVFDKYEDRYFLARIHQAGGNLSYEVWRGSEGERLAKNKSDRQQITVTGNQR